MPRVGHTRPSKTLHYSFLYMTVVKQCYLIVLYFCAKNNLQEKKHTEEATESIDLKKRVSAFCPILSPSIKKVYLVACADQ